MLLFALINAIESQITPLRDELLGVIAPILGR